MTGRRWDLGTAEGWRQFVDAPRLPRPERLSEKQLHRLGDHGRMDYLAQRTAWHANFGLIRTPQLDQAHAMLDLISSADVLDSDRTGGSAVIDALPGLGKTTLANSFGKNLDRDQRSTLGEQTSDGDRRVPVVRVGLSAQTTLKSLNFQLARFYGHPGTYRATSAERLAGFAADCVRSCDTRLVIIDDVHRVNPSRRDGLAVTEHLKFLADEMPATFLYIGVALKERGLYAEGLGGHRAALAQTGRRWTRVSVQPFTITDDVGKADWLRMLHAIEDNMVLARHRPGTLGKLAAYLYDRTGGYIGSLMTLIRRGARLAITRGDEAITREVLDAVPIDQAAEDGRSPRTLTHSGAR